MKLRAAHVCLIPLTLAFTPGCGGDDKKSSTGNLEGCTTTVSSEGDAYQTLQTAFDGVNTNETICLSPGTYVLNRSLSLSEATGVTVKGTGARDDVLLDFTSQTSGDGGVDASQGVLVTTDGFTIENLSIKNTDGNGIKVQASDVVFRNIKVGWDQAVSTNGAYAIYPTFATNVLVDNCEAYGAPDAGFYAGTSNKVTIRNSKAYNNVLGIEIENTTEAEAYGNEVYDNACGFLLDLLPNLQKKTQGQYLVHDNTIRDNNHANFAKPQTTPAYMPTGTGIMVLAASDVEIRDNTFTNNGGSALTIVSYDTVDLAAAIGGQTTPEAWDPGTNRFPERVYVHGNTFTNNGQAPQGIYLDAATAAGLTTIPYNVAWDGTLRHDQNATTTLTDADAQICLGTAEQASFMNFHGANLLLDPSKWTTDVTAHQCTLPAVPPLAAP